MIYIISIFISFLFSEISPGYTLFSPLSNQGGGNYITYLIDNEGNYINTWSHDCRPVSISYLLPDSSLVVPCTQNEVDGLGGGNQSSGGRILKLSWTGDVLWDDIFVEDYFQPHHDIEPLDNGNILFVTYERKTYAEAIAMGRENIDDEIWPTMIIELEQTGVYSSEIVWEWHLWDHTIQDINSNLDNYGVISEHPELLDINLGTLGGGGGSSGDWIHTNSIDYNENLDILVISSRKMNEFYFIDHSTTSQEASSHSGGNYNRGGDILYRWGNPQNYQRGNSQDQILISQHSVNWISDGYPGEGNIILFNNRTEEMGSEVLELAIPYYESFLINEGEIFLPQEPLWDYSEGSFFSNIQSGAFRLKNGNTLISIGDEATFFEIDSLENLLWEYTFQGPSGQEFNGNIPRAQKYDPEYFNLPLIGDLNSDSIINILDVVLMINIILDEHEIYDYSYIADLNEDMNIDIIDIVLLVNIITGE